MKYTIDYNNVARDITGPFNIIGSPADLLYIADQIRMQVGNPDHPNFSYGTVFISQRYVPTDNSARHVKWTEGVPDATPSMQTLTPKDVPVAQPAYPRTPVYSFESRAPTREDLEDKYPMMRSIRDSDYQNLLAVLEFARDVLASRYTVTDFDTGLSAVEAVKKGKLRDLATAVQQCSNIKLGS